MNNINKEKGFFVYLGLIFSVAIILVLVLILLNTYYKKPAMDVKTEKFISGYGIDTTNYSNIVDTTRSKVKGIEQQMQDYNKKLEDASYK